MSAGFAIRLPANRVKVSSIDRHQFICDLVFIEGPLLSLFRDSRNSWFYLWCDTDGLGRDRWLVFQVSRRVFAEYLSGFISLRTAVFASRDLLCLEGDTRESLDGEADEGRRSRQLWRVRPSDIEEYLPSDQSLFDQSLSPDISLEEQLLPRRYPVAIGGDWFVGDLDRFSRAYSGLYGFFYCSKPRLVASIQSRLNRALRAPWEGGFSRVNLFDALAKAVPSFHDMQIRRIQYASPGSIEIEALESVGQDIQASVGWYLTNRPDIDEHAKIVNALLSACRFKRRNLSSVSDALLGISEESISAFKGRTREIAELLRLEQQIGVLIDESPNCVVAAKAALALLTHLRKLADFESAGMLNLTGRGAESENFDSRDDWLQDFERATGR
jgi:hypothetical protein